MRETTTGYAALFGAQFEEQRRSIRPGSFELATTLDKLQAQLAASSRHKGWELLANFTSQRPH